MKYIKLTLIGLLLGVVNIVPGVSSGTLAVVTNTYDYLINALSLDFRYIKQNFWEIIFLVVGIIAGIFCFSFIISYLLLNYFCTTMFFFIGLILGGVPLIFRQANTQPNTSMKWVKYLALVAGLTLLILLTIIKAPTNALAQTSVTFGQGIVLAMCCALGAFGMVLPGISGSLILMILGAYNTVITAIKTLNIGVLTYTCIGMAIGVLIGACLIKYLLKKYPKVTYYAIIGLVMGSIIAIFPGARGGWWMPLDVVTVISGCVVGYLLSKIGRSKASVKKNDDKNI